ncbi:MAG: hypothetical protein KJ550_12645 [Proteobacteria bacterium]|nr:hypothetical protein [Desulfobacteraceae bacterium]MBU3981806.1 hypothetical protein [Pseudomonadota bacterium]MBU4103412.1 hypothetical protein [Patescibacteria group bacterium]MBU4014293.1 hypothetical protein [Pseudomonadota bacterium]MBU4067919.1 hypothetical protein [Pseudomonadota bacterium]
MVDNKRKDQTNDGELILKKPPITHFSSRPQLNKEADLTGQAVLGKKEVREALTFYHAGRCQ